MKVQRILVGVFCFVFAMASVAEEMKIPPEKHPKSEKWEDLIKKDFSNAIVPDDIWKWEEDVLTASEDQNIWTKEVYNNFVLDLEFKNAEGTNSGVIVYCSDVENWIPNSIEIQIADDYSEQWSEQPKSWQCAAFFGHKGAKESRVKKPGKWNRMTITCKDHMIYVMLNGKQVNKMNMKKYTSAEENPDGTEIPSWLSKPKAKLETKGHIGFQGKHGGAPIYFRNLKIKEIEEEK